MIVVYCANRLTDRRCNAVAQLPATIPCNFGLGIPTEAWDTRHRYGLRLFETSVGPERAELPRDPPFGNVLRDTNDDPDGNAPLSSFNRD